MLADTAFLLSYCYMLSILATLLPSQNHLYFNVVRLLKA